VADAVRASASIPFYYEPVRMAGGGFEHYNFSSPVNQQRVVQRLGRQLVPFALIPSATAPELDDDLPMDAAALIAILDSWATRAAKA